MRGFQLWVNLPARDKMSDPKYQEYAPDKIPVAHPAAGVTVKVIAGAVGDVHGPIVQPATEPVYLDIALAPETSWDYLLPAGHNAFAYAFEGAATVGEGARPLPAQELAVLGGGERLRLPITRVSLTPAPSEVGMPRMVRSTCAAVEVVVSLIERSLCASGCLA